LTRPRRYGYRKFGRRA
ncbi:MAG: hypothetical protein ACN6N0_09505, partial [Microvirgula sp.]